MSKALKFTFLFVFVVFSFVFLVFQSDQVRAGGLCPGTSSATEVLGCSEGFVQVQCSGGDSDGVAGVQCEDLKYYPSLLEKARDEGCCIPCERDSDCPSGDVCAGYCFPAPEDIDPMFTELRSVEVSGIFRPPSLFSHIETIPLDGSHFVVAYDHYSMGFSQYHFLGLVGVAHFDGSNLVWDVNPVRFTSSNAKERITFHVARLDSSHFAVVYSSYLYIPAPKCKNYPDAKCGDDTLIIAYPIIKVGEFTGSKIKWIASDSHKKSVDTHSLANRYSEVSRTIPYSFSIYPLTSHSFVLVSAFKNGNELKGNELTVISYENSSIYFSQAYRLPGLSRPSELTVAPLDGSHFAVAYTILKHHVYGEYPIKVGVMKFPPNNFSPMWGLHLNWQVPPTILTSYGIRPLGVLSFPNSNRFVVLYSDTSCKNSENYLRIAHYQDSEIVWDSDPLPTPVEIKGWVTSVKLLDSSHILLSYHNRTAEVISIIAFNSSSVSLDSPEMVFNKGAYPIKYLSFSHLKDSDYLLSYSYTLSEIPVIQKVSFTLNQDHPSCPSGEVWNGSACVISSNLSVLAGSLLNFSRKFWKGDDFSLFCGNLSEVLPLWRGGGFGCVLRGSRGVVSGFVLDGGSVSLSSVLGGFGFDSGLCDGVLSGHGSDSGWFACDGDAPPRVWLDPGDGLLVVSKGGVNLNGVGFFSDPFWVLVNFLRGLFVRDSSVVVLPGGFDGFYYRFVPLGSGLVRRVVGFRFGSGFGVEFAGFCSNFSDLNLPRGRGVFVGSNFSGSGFVVRVNGSSSAFGSWPFLTGGLRVSGVGSECGCAPRNVSDACAGVECGVVSDGCAGFVGCGGCGSGEVCSSYHCCPSDRPVWDGSGCVECLSSGDCGVSKPYCVSEKCVECLSDGDCSGSTPVCDLTSHVCVACPSDRPKWDGSKCVECLSDADCGSGYTCDLTSHTCVEKGCTPKSRDEACGTWQCGLASDGCGGTVSCGSCDTGYSCDTTTHTCVESGGGGDDDGGNNDNGVDCDKECHDAGYECGSLTVGDTTCNCGGCQGDQVCDKGQCYDPCLDYDCGSVTVNGKNFDCGSCGLYEKCSNHKCVCSYTECSGTCCPEGDVCYNNNCCTPTPASTACSGYNCGDVSDGCGGTIHCGDCSNNELCCNHHCFLKSTGCPS